MGMGGKRRNYAENMPRKTGTKSIPTSVLTIPARRKRRQISNPTVRQITLTAIGERASFAALKLDNPSVLRTSCAEREAEIADAEMVVDNVKHALEVHTRQEINENKDKPTL